MDAKEQCQKLGPVGRRAILLLPYAAKVVAIRHPASGCLDLLLPTGIGWANVWFNRRVSSE